MPRPPTTAIPELADPSNNIAFSAFVARYTANDSVKDMLARAAKVDVSTITQWGAGSNLPDASVRAFVVRWIQGCPATYGA